MKNKVINNNLNTISDCIVNFLRNEARYKAHAPAELGINADPSNVIYLMEDSLPDGIKFNIKDDCINNEIYIGSRNRMKGVNVTITITGSGCALFIGDRCNLTTLNIGIVEDSDAVCIGHAVSVASKNMWTTGTHSGADGKAIIVGDDCMFSSDIAIRGSDGHPVLLIDDLSQTNIPRLPVIIEPHCWIGQGAFIQKCVTVGACSIIAAKSIVTKSAPRFSLLAGSPAQRKSLEGKVWARHLGENAVKKAALWAEKYHIPAPQLTRRQKFMSRILPLKQQASSKCQSLFGIKEKA